MTPFVLNDFLPYRISVTAARVSRAFERRYMAETGLSVSEWRVMAHLLNEAEISVREIEARVDMEKSKVSRAASRLQTEGLITKRVNPDDRRLVSLSLTDKGRALLDRLIPMAHTFQAELIALLEPEAAAFDRALGTLMKGRL